jgi:hypothetical protein
MQRLVARLRADEASEPDAGIRHGRPDSGHWPDEGYGRLRVAGAFVATLAAGLVIGLWWPRTRDRTPVAVDSSSASTAAKRPVQFVFVAPRARHVTLVGEFNGWKPGATPMTLAPDGRVWAVSVELPPGRHVYAFVVDDSTWVADPQAPIAPEAWYGVRNSVVVVADRGKR